MFYLSSRFVLFVAYTSAETGFLLTVNLGILHLPIPLYGNLMPPDRPPFPLELKAIGLVIAMFSFHFLRRIAEVLLLQHFRENISIIKSIAWFVYFTFFGFWLGASVTIRHYREEFAFNLSKWPLIFVGLLLWLIGEGGNCYFHVILSRIPKYNGEGCSSSYPNHLIFRLIACPHYLFEILSWLGFGMVVFTMASWCFLATTIILLSIRGRLKLRNYKTEFGNRTSYGSPYFMPKNCLVPYVF